MSYDIHIGDTVEWNWGQFITSRNPDDLAAFSATLLHALSS